MKRILRLILIGLFMGLSIAAAPGADDTGAATTWTSNDPLVAEARRLLLAGEIARAEALVADHPQHAEVLDIARRFRREYQLDEAGLLAKLSRDIPGMKSEDLRIWREAGEVQFRILDGEVRYFRREPSNIFRFCSAAKERQANEKTTVAAWKLSLHLSEVIAAGERASGPEVTPLNHRVTFTLAIPPGAGRAKAGSVARIWLPFPQEYRQQKGVKLLGSEPAPTHVAENGTPHRTLYYERKIEDPKKPVVVKAVFGYTSYAYYPQLRDDVAKPLAPDWEGTSEYLAERSPHIVFTPELRAKVKTIVGAEPNPLARARKIFHWIDGNVRYCAEEEYCLIPSISQKALKSLKGDCGVQSMLFITMCRAAGVPARWQSGWETKPVNWNMHDWAEFYVEPWGWLPADVSYGLQKSDDPKIREFYFGHQDSLRLISNLDYGRPLVPEKKSLRSEPADFQRGEVEIDGGIL